MGGEEPRPCDGPPAGKSVTIRQALRKGCFPRQLSGGPPDVHYSVSDQRLVVYLAPFLARRHQSGTVPSDLDTVFRSPARFSGRPHPCPRLSRPPRASSPSLSGRPRLRRLADRTPRPSLRPHGGAGRGLAPPLPRRVSPRRLGPRRLLPSPPQGVPHQALLPR